MPDIGQDDKDININICPKVTSLQTSGNTGELSLSAMMNLVKMAGMGCEAE